MAGAGGTWGQNVDEWVASLPGLLTAPTSSLWWPGLTIAALAGVWLGRKRRHQGRGADYWRELPIDAACFLANSALPFLLAPWLYKIGLIGARVGGKLAFAAGSTPASDVPAAWPALLLCAAIAFVAGDFALYWTHRLFHVVPPLWRSHRLHHAPAVLTPLTAYRFWPWEQAVHLTANMLGQGVALGLAVGLMGVAASPLTLLGVNVFTLIWTLGFAHLRHSPIPLAYPRWLSLWLISPHMHQLHHSMAPEHHDRNYGTALAIWDRMFGTLVLDDPKRDLRFGAA